MKILFLDDARQRKPMREKMNEIVGVGGLFLDADSVGSLETDLDKLCLDVGLNADEVFKWAPAKTDWFRDNVGGEKRTEFIMNVLDACNKAGAKAIVSICDTSKGRANGRTSDHEIDALLLTMERFHTQISDSGLVLVAKPGGGNTDEGKMLAECLKHVQKGTEFVDFNQIALKPLTLPFGHSRILQAADLVCSITTAMVANNTRFAKEPFENIKPLFISDWRGLVGGTGLKIHPDFLYQNLYHWVLGEEHMASGSSGVPYPITSRPYSSGPDDY